MKGSPQLETNSDCTRDECIHAFEWLNSFPVDLSNNLSFTFYFEDPKVSSVQPVQNALGLTGIPFGSYNSTPSYISNTVSTIVTWTIRMSSLQVSPYKYDPNV